MNINSKNYVSMGEEITSISNKSIDQWLKENKKITDEDHKKRFKACENRLKSGVKTSGWGNDDWMCRYKVFDFNEFKKWGNLAPKKTKSATYNDLAISLGCGIKRRDVDYCVKRYLRFSLGMHIENIEDVKKQNKETEQVRGEIVHTLDAINRAKNQSHEQQGGQQEGKQEGAVWRIDNAGRGWWDYGNGTGYMPPNHFYDKIISGFSLDSGIKQRLYTGSGRSVTINNGFVNVW